MLRLATDLDAVAMDDQGTLAARPVSSGGSPGKRGRYYKSTDDGRMWRDNGTGWDEIPFVQPTIGALPSTPYDGQEIYILADATNGIVWHLKYRTASGSVFKWEWIGGSALVHSIATSEHCTAIAFGDLTTVGPTITVPFKGDYEIFFAANATTFLAGDHMGVGINNAGSVSTGSTAYHTAVNFPGGANGDRHHICRKYVTTAALASTVLKMVYSAGTIAGGNSDAAFKDRFLSIRPVRVGV